MTDTQKNLETVLKTLAQAELLLADGQQIDDVCEQIGVDKDTLQAWANHLSLPQNPAEVLSSCHIHDAVFPSFPSSPQKDLAHRSIILVLAS